MECCSITRRNWSQEIFRSRQKQNARKRCCAELIARLGWAGAKFKTPAATVRISTFSEKVLKPARSKSDSYTQCTAQVKMRRISYVKEQPLTRSTIISRSARSK